MRNTYTMKDVDFFIPFFGCSPYHFGGVYGILLRTIYRKQNHRNGGNRSVARLANEELT